MREYKNVRQFTVIAPTGGFQTDGKLAFGMDAAAHLELVIQYSDYSV